MRNPTDQAGFRQQKPLQNKRNHFNRTNRSSIHAHICARDRQTDRQRAYPLRFAVLPTDGGGDDMTRNSVSPFPFLLLQQTQNEKKKNRAPLATSPAEPADRAAPGREPTAEPSPAPDLGTTSSPSRCRRGEPPPPRLRRRREGARPAPWAPVPAAPPWWGWTERTVGHAPPRGRGRGGGSCSLACGCRRGWFARSALGVGEWGDGGGWGVEQQCF